MSIVELLLMAVALSMDAFAVSICTGLEARQVRPRDYICIGAWFGGFQALMPFLGYLAGSAFQQVVDAFSDWIAFGLLAFLGIRMIIGAIKDDDTASASTFRAKELFLLAVATSIDALAVGISFAVMGTVNIYFAILVIGLTTFAFSAGGLWIGKKFGSKFKKQATIAGGVILVAIGLKILLEGLGVISL